MYVLRQSAQPLACRGLTTSDVADAIFVVLFTAQTLFNRNNSGELHPATLEHIASHRSGLTTDFA